jgi:hypothetical protein
MKKEITIDYNLYREEYDKQYTRGYEASFIELSKFLILTDTQNADIYLEALDDFCSENETFELIEKIKLWYKGLKNEH